jgi:predicted nucleotidyltransferase
MNPELEQYRRDAIESLKANAAFLRETAQAVLGMPVLAVYVVGSVLDRDAFREDSDVDVAVVVAGPDPDMGLSESLSETLQAEMVRNPIGDIGVVNTLVFVNELRLVRGRSLRIAGGRRSRASVPERRVESRRDPGHPRRRRLPPYLPLPDSRFRIGDRVEVLGGPHAYQSGTIEYVGSGPRGDKVSVRLDHPVQAMLGAVPIDPSYLRVTRRSSMEARRGR